MGELPKDLSQFFKGVGFVPSNKPVERTRICPDCRIQWQYTDKMGNCPSCDQGPFFSMNAADTGCFIYLQQAGLKLSDFKPWAPPKHT